MPIDVKAKLDKLAAEDDGRSMNKMAVIFIERQIKIEELKAKIPTLTEEYAAPEATSNATAKKLTHIP